MRAVFWILILFCCFAADELQAELHAAAAKVDITPTSPQWLMGYAARRSTGVHDRIFHRVVLLDDGKTQLYLVSSDLCLFSPSVYDELAAELEAKFRIPRLQFWWTVTHTHSAPEVGPPGIYDVLLKGRSDHAWDQEYFSMVKSSLLAVIGEVRNKRTPARISVGAGFSRANINRRARDLDGTVRLGLNPDGPADRQIGVIRIERPDGSLIALVANYAVHATALGGRFLEVSGDVPGTVAAHVESVLGAPMLFVNGAAGDLAPIYTVQNDVDSARLSEFRVLLGERILQASRSLPPGQDSLLWLGETWIETPRKAGLSWPPELSRYSSETPGPSPRVRIPVRFLRIQDAVIWAAPLELFCEIAMRVRQESRFRFTFFFGYTNGWLGYLPTAEAFREGGYEPRTAVVTERAERDLIEGVLAYLDGMGRR
ncbi:MAG: neutral/alkaline non-lysosomal ceramidase N-terminal domain-containing protein [Bryobacteraceae bacterium]|nr:neutral/alkaline non-lysosomal ceramidase N-terminal domain-containing protein [Bryobacteraceae bacterium]MDW8377874.1 neutral/alkaline non-lysosomal ceramidase N-terminal domain-containing protein [Bryobacterales bacterium]